MTVQEQYQPKEDFLGRDFFFNGEWMLVLMLILVNVFNISASPYYAHAKSILNATRDFLDKAIVVISDGIRINAR